MSVDLKLRTFRKACLSGSNVVMAHVNRNYVVRVDGRAIKHKEPDICMFCGSADKITKEHVLPKWTFEATPERFFITDINGANQTYIKATIPACDVCNNNLLSSLERYVTKLLEDTDLNQTFFSNYEKQHIIRWLETIDYKFSILNIRRRFLKSANGPYIPYLADFPLSFLRLDKAYSERSVIAELRRSRRRLIGKDKSSSLNSLVVFKTKNLNFFFFHHMDDFIYVELPCYKVALFHFFKKTFETEVEAHDAALAIITKQYS